MNSYRTRGSAGRAHDLARTILLLLGLGGQLGCSDAGDAGSNTSGAPTGTGGTSSTQTSTLTSSVTTSGTTTATGTTTTTATAATGSSSTGSTSGGAGGSTSNSGTESSTSAGGSGGCQEYVMQGDCTIPEGAVLPSDLRCTGLYGNWEQKSYACGVLEYQPAYQLWSDAAEKRRFVQLPAGERVDVSDPDDFRYPVGTQFWKEFHVQTDSGTLLGETRLMRRVDNGWIYTSYVWNETGTEAVQQNEGVSDLLGSGHTVPSREQCKDCHAGRPDFILGWDALMLGDGATGVTAVDLVDLDLVTWTNKDTGAENPLALSIPGDEVEQAALGYLHANCGVSCHNDTSRALALETGLIMRLDRDSLDSVLTTPVWTTGNNRTPNPNAPLTTLDPPASGDPYVDLAPLEPERSLIYVRVTHRQDDIAMPPTGTNRVDEAGTELIKSWIEQMTALRGYPEP